MQSPTTVSLRIPKPSVLALLFALSIPATDLAAQAEPEKRQPAPSETTLGADYSFAYFEGSIDPWHVGAFSLGRRGHRGSIISRLNVARRFGTTGTQVELDAYPSLGEGTYAYLNAGYSGASIFPEWRFGGEVFRSLPRAYEASVGFRQLRFGGTPVTLLTGSVGRYVGNYWFSLRPYFRDKAAGPSASASLTARRYFEDADNYLGARVGYGSTPGDNIVGDELTRASSFVVGVAGSRSVAHRTIGTLSLTHDREELTPDRIRKRWELSTGLKVRF